MCASSELFIPLMRLRQAASLRVGIVPRSKIRVSRAGCRFRAAPSTDPCLLEHRIIFQKLTARQAVNPFWGLGSRQRECPERPRGAKELASKKATSSLLASRSRPLPCAVLTNEMDEVLQLALFERTIEKPHRSASNASPLSLVF